MYRVVRMYNVTKGYGHFKKETRTSSLSKARAVAKAWCSGRKPERDRAAIISKFVGTKKVAMLETYVEDTGGSGRAVCTRRYNAKTGRSTEL